MTLNINSEPCPLHRIMFEPIIDGGCPLCVAEAGTADGKSRLILSNGYFRLFETIRLLPGKQDFRTIWTQDYLSHLTKLRAAI